MAKKPDSVLSKKERLFQNYSKKKLKQENRGTLFESLSRSCIPKDAKGYISFKTGYTKMHEWKKPRLSDCDKSILPESPEESEGCLSSDMEIELNEDVVEANEAIALNEQVAKDMTLDSCCDDALTDTPVVPLENPFAPFAVTFFEPLPKLIDTDHLPIVKEESQLMEMILQYPIVLVQGATGSGKTTQIPQFLYAYGFGNQNCAARQGMICVTEPRRLAAISMAERVIAETGQSELVSYHVRYANTRTEKTRILFMTEGILLKEIQSDFMLSQYSVIVLDEVHERHLNTDLLLILLTRIVALREKEFIRTGQGSLLKVVIMSATVQKEGLSRIFDRAHFPSLAFVEVDKDDTEENSLVEFPPIMRIPDRQFEVTMHYEKSTPLDYLDAAYKKILKIHKKLPCSGASGHILVFVPGKRDVWDLIHRLRNKSSCLVETASEQHVDNSILSEDESEDGSWESSDAGSESEDTADEMPSMELFTLPLYSLLDYEKQILALDPIKALNGRPGRVCIVSTNVSETSVTIPGVSYIVDTGKVKLKSSLKTVDSYEVSWVSQASADQRAGRAGRTGPGHCYRLYSRAVYHELFAEETEAEILRTPLDSLVLYLKSFHIHEPNALPWPTRPDPLRLAEAERELTVIGLLKDNHITPLGESALRHAVSPRYAKMICLAEATKNMLLLNSVLLCVAALSVGQLCGGSLREYTSLLDERLISSDLLVLVALLVRAQKDKHSGDDLNWKNVEQARQLYAHLCKDLNLSVNYVLPSTVESVQLIQLYLTCNPTRVARKTSGDREFQFLGFSKTSEALLCAGSNKKLFQYPISSWFESSQETTETHRSSSVIVSRKTELYVVYDTMVRNENGKLKMNIVSPVQPQWILKFCKGLCPDGKLPL